MSKKSSRKNSNYKNNNYKKEFNTMNNNIHFTDEHAMEAREAAQQKLLAITKNAFRAAGFSTSFLENPLCLKAAIVATDIEKTMKGWERFAGQNVADYVLDNCANGFNAFLTLSIKEFENRSEYDRFSIFLQTLICLSYHNHLHRAEFLNELARIKTDNMGKEFDRGASRAWDLLMCLLVPDMVA